MSGTLFDWLSRLQTRHPLLLFLLLGAAIFALQREPAGGEEPTSPAIALSPEQIQALQAEYPGEPVTGLRAGQLRAVLGDWLDREALYLEARRLGLEAGDPIIARRLVQKMQVLLEDLHPLPEPTDAELQAWLDAQDGEQYGQPPRYSFDQVFLARGRHREPLPELAATTLAELRAGQADYRNLGDPFVTGARVERISPRELRKHFGKPFADALAGLAAGDWAGPLHSAYGLHLVRLTAFEPFRRYTLDEARSRILQDYRLAQRAERNRELVDALIERYRPQPATTVRDLQ